MKKMSLNRKLAILLFFVVGLSVVTHLTPALAVRTKLFSQGYFKEACFSELQPVQAAEKASAEGEGFTYYKASPAPFEKATQSPLETYRAGSFLGLFYWADYYGEV